MQQFTQHRHQRQRQNKQSKTKHTPARPFKYTGCGPRMPDCLLISIQNNLPNGVKTKRRYDVIAVYSRCWLDTESEFESSAYQGVVDISEIQLESTSVAGLCRAYNYVTGYYNNGHGGAFHLRSTLHSGVTILPTLFDFFDYKTIASYGYLNLT